MDFKLRSANKPIEEQEKAINKIIENFKSGEKYQTLLGVTGSGKTFTTANVIQRLNKPTLIMSHNKTLAAQLYQEMHDLFPENAVSYFVSYYDYYQPESYIPSTDTYIEKDSAINELIDKLRLATTANLLTRKDCIVVASVSSIYNIGSPNEYGKFAFEFVSGMKITREQIMDRILDLQYERSEFGFNRGTFRIRGDVIDVYPAYTDDGVRIELGNNNIKSVKTINTITGELKEVINTPFTLYPAKHFITDPKTHEGAFTSIKKDLDKRVLELREQNKLLEAQRIAQRVNYDLEMIKEIGYVKGIENYSRYFDGRKEGDTPFTLLDYFKANSKKFGNTEADYLVIVDESHITFPQVRGMYNGDRSRKQTLIDYGFRLPSALDNRPLKFEEFLRRIPNFLALSATPDEWELSMSGENIVEQLIRPTGIPDPEVTIKPTTNQVSDVIEEIKKEVESKRRVLVTTLTKKMAEDLTEYLQEKGLKVAYLHSDVDTLDRTDILDNLRKGNYDCLIGINLLREGLDLPEVGLVAILDADKEGFLRSQTALIQTMGRAARHVEGRVIMYADKITGSMERSLEEVKRRRQYQIEINKKYGITPKSIVKPIREKIIEREDQTKTEKALGLGLETFAHLPDIDITSLTPMDKKRLIKNLQKEMVVAAKDLNFELAIEIRDRVNKLTEETE
jgi:excinuclease ABC subunit B